MRQAFLIIFECALLASARLYWSFVHNCWKNSLSVWGIVWSETELRSGLARRWKRPSSEKTVVSKKAQYMIQRVKRINIIYNNAQGGVWNSQLGAYGKLQITNYPHRQPLDPCPLPAFQKSNSHIVAHDQNNFQNSYPNNGLILQINSHLAKNCHVTPTTACTRRHRGVEGGEARGEVGRRRRDVWCGDSVYRSGSGTARLRGWDAHLRGVSYCRWHLSRWGIFM